MSSLAGRLNEQAARQGKLMLTICNLACFTSAHSCERNKAECGQVDICALPRMAAN